MAVIKGTAPPLCKLCGKRHWRLCPENLDVDRLLEDALKANPKNALGRKKK